LYGELVSIYVINFVIRLYLIFLINIQTSDITGLKFSPSEPNRPSLLAIYLDVGLYSVIRASSTELYMAIHDG
jgi:hypothetical protein